MYQRRRLLAKNGDSCCVCHETDVHLDLHHIDGDACNTVDENLAVLSINDHCGLHRKEGSQVNHTELQKDQIALHKIKWERFIAEIKQPNPRIVGFVCSYVSGSDIHSVSAVLQWATGEVACAKTFTLQDGPASICFQKAKDYIKGFSAQIRWAYGPQPIALEYCPCCQKTS